MYEECYAALGRAIVEQAARDFCEAIRDNDVCKYGSAKHYLQSKLCALHSGRDTLPDIEYLEKNVRKYLKIAEEKTTELLKINNKPVEPIKAYICPICSSDVYINYGHIAYKKSIKKYLYGYNCRCFGCAFNTYKVIEQRDEPIKKAKRPNKKRIYLTYNGETRPLKEWAEITGVPYATMVARHTRGYTTEEILSGQKLYKRNKHNE